ncbi:MAG: energy transducer TonB [Bacteroidetes bacterium]|nr:energy transducer TonB [Bacteroidota bacterium]
MPQQQKNSERNYRISGLAGTLLFHGLLLLGMLLVLYHTPIPPFPETGGGQGSGLEVNLGYSDDGTGDFQATELSIPQFKEAAKPSTTVTVAENKVKTNTAGEDLMTDEKGENTNLNTEASGKVKKVVKEPVPVVNTNALYKKPSKSGASQGITGKPGDQGKPEGVANSKVYTGNGNGNGNGNGTGQGNGSGNGIGNGSGDGVGNGISFTLQGRTSTSLPKPAYNSDEQGRVVVTIYVNREGKVTRVSAGAKGTTTSDQQLWDQAANAARRATFAPSPNAPDEQKGTITYKFVKTR